MSAAIQLRSMLPVCHGRSGQYSWKLKKVVSGQGMHSGKKFLQSRPLGKAVMLLMCGKVKMKLSILQRLYLQSTVVLPAISAWLYVYTYLPVYSSNSPTWFSPCLSGLKTTMTEALNSKSHANWVLMTLPIIGLWLDSYSGQMCGNIYTHQTSGMSRRKNLSNV